MKQLFLLLSFLLVGNLFAQQAQMLRIPTGSGYTFLNLDQVRKVDSIGATETRVYTNQRTYYTVAESFSDFMDRSGHCKLLKIETQRGRTLAIPYESIDLINYFSANSGIIRLKDKYSLYTVVNMSAVRDSILYAQCGLATPLNSIPYEVDSVSVTFDSTYSGADHYNVVIHVVGTQSNQVNAVNLIYEEPFNGEQPDEQETQCTARGGGYFDGVVTFPEASTGNTLDIDYQCLTDMIDSNGDPIGSQQAFDVYPQN